MNPIDPVYLASTPIMDKDHPRVLEFAEKAADSAADPVQTAVRLYYAVRDGIWYDPYYPFFLPEHYRASRVLKSGRGYCVSKAALLCTLGRACGIPARVGFATVRNHLTTRQLSEMLGTDLFVYHGYTEFHLENQWVKATPAFNRELCERHRVPPLEFDGRTDSLFQAYNREQKRFMEYVDDHGHYADVPVERIVRAWRETYGRERVDGWIRGFESSGNGPARDFFSEDIVK